MAKQIYLPKSKPIYLLKYWMMDWPKYSLTDSEMPMDWPKYSLMDLPRSKPKYLSMDSTKYWRLGLLKSMPIYFWRSKLKGLQKSMPMDSRKQIPMDLKKSMLMDSERPMDLKKYWLTSMLKYFWKLMPKYWPMDF